MAVLIACFMSCSTTKNIPEGQYLMNDYKIKVSDKNIDAANLENFVRQKPNSSFLFFGKMRLGIYNAAGQDTSKWLTRTIKKVLGQPPVIFNGRQTEISATQIEKELSNQGYLSAKVDTAIKIKGKKASVTYNVDGGIPYKIRNYEYTISDTTISRILKRMRRMSNVKPGMLFDKEMLEEDRGTMNSIMRNVGYYSFSKENLYYRADTTLNSHQVDLYLSLYRNPDSTDHKRYRLRNVTITSGYDVTDDNNRDNFQNPDTFSRRGITIIHGKNNFLRNSTLLRNNYLRPGALYSDIASSITYSAYSGISAIKQTSINFVPVKSDSVNLLDVNITLAPSKVHWFQAGIDGTNSAGDIGIAPSVSYQHKNIFNGAEILGVKLKGAYEFITGKKNTDLLDKNYYEYGIDLSLSFPQFLFPWMKNSWREIPSASTQISLGHTNQHRAEYTRQFFNATYTFRWMTQRRQLSHSLDLLDVNYVRMPWVSNEFEKYLNNDILKATYQDQLIARTGYGITYTRASRGRRYPKNSYTIRGTLDLAGWLPHLTKGLANLKKNANGQYEIVGIAYAEYVKTTLSFSQTRNFDKYRSFAYNIALGLANPFGNSEVLPYEKRFFSGGANSVRGWNTRRLGPGSYKTNDSTSFVNQVGDIKLDLNVEYRNRIGEMIELAGFIDAGNIWTIKEYQGQEGGLFKFSDFYKEIAVAYGLGLRIDLNFLLLRLDFGRKAYDPSRDEGKRFVMLKEKFLPGWAWHFAIGYPF